MREQIAAVAGRVVQQLRHDRRFLALSVIVPIAVIVMLDLFFSAVERPFMQPEQFVPPVGAYLVHFLTYVLCAIVLVRERTQQTMNRMFVSGYTRTSIIGGYVLAYSIIATVQSTLVMLLLGWLFELDYSGAQYAMLFGVIWLLAMISIALGILVSNFARNEGQVLPMVPLVLLPSAFFSGMIVGVDLLPGWIQPLAYITPMFYATNAVHEIDNLRVILLLPLVAYGVVVMALAIVTLREQG